MLALGWMLLQFSYSFAAVKPFNLVTDIDDTLKVSNVKSKLEVLVNGVYPGVVFTGMSELYRAVAENAASVIYLSGSPQTLIPSLQTLLVDQHFFPAGTFVLRNWFQLQRTAEFKRQQLNRIANENQLPFWMVGDDTDLDAEVFSHFERSHLLENSDGVYESRVIASYIHRVEGRRTLPQNVTPFVTAFDLALYEVEAERITPAQAVRVGLAILGASDHDPLFPKFKYCPEDFEYSMGPKERNYLGPIAFADFDLSVTSEMIKRQIRRICMERK